MDRPSPVPPYLRLVVPSACWKAPKIVSSCCSAMPMPVSMTRKATTGPPPARRRRAARRSAAGSMRSSTLPCSVNFTALDSRLRSTCRSRASSVSSSAGDAGRGGDRELQALLRGQRPERRLDVLEELAQRDRARG